MGEVTLELYKAQERNMAAREARRGVRVHAAVTVAVVLALVAVNVFVAPEFPWSVFPALGMSIGLWFHWYFAVRRGEEFMHLHQEDVQLRASRKAA